LSEATPNHQNETAAQSGKKKMMYRGQVRWV